nr:exosortase/archaeosortase family protein [Rhodococcus sp. CH91]
MPLDMRSLVPTVPGVPWWAAVAIAAGTTLVGVLLDSARGNELTAAFTAFYVLGCVAAVVAVRYRGLFTAMAQPPLLLFVAVPIGQQFVSSESMSGLQDLALNIAYPLVNRFPAMLLATVLALAVGGFRIYVARQATGVRAARAPRERARPRAAKAKTAAPGDRPARRAARGRPSAATATRGGTAVRTPSEKASVRDVTDTRPRRRVRAERAVDEHPVPRRTRAPRPADPVPAEDRRPRRRPVAPEPEVGRPAAAPTQAAPTQAYDAPRVRYRDRYED